MKLKQLASNMTELDLGNGTSVLFSYETPVAARILTSEGMEYYITDQFYSRTTSKHINKYILPGLGRVTRPQSFFDELVR